MREMIPRHHPATGIMPLDAGDLAGYSQRHFQRDAGHPGRYASRGGHGTACQGSGPRTLVSQRIVRRWRASLAPWDFEIIRYSRDGCRDVSQPAGPQPVNCMMRRGDFESRKKTRGIRCPRQLLPAPAPALHLCLVEVCTVHLDYLLNSWTQCLTHLLSLLVSTV